MNDFRTTIWTLAIAAFVLTLTFLVTERETAALQHTTSIHTVASTAKETITAEMKSGEVGRLLLVEPPSAQDDKQKGAAVERPTLPNTASDLPVIVLVGALAVAGWVVFRFTHSKPNS